MSDALEIAIERLSHAEGMPLPEPASAGAAGLDLAAAIPANEPLVIRPGERAMVPTGLRMALPTGFEAQVRPRSGLAWKHGVTVLNSPGTIDSDYRGEVCVILVNLGTKPFAIERGMRIAQMVVAPVMAVVWNERPVTPEESARGRGGFGSTGTGHNREEHSA